MKPALEHLPRGSNESFVVKHFEYAYYPTPWHYHPEYEIVWVTESTGQRIIGDHISGFEPGNLALIGPNIPHIYKNDSAYYQPGHSRKARSVVIHFTAASLGYDFLELPESSSLRMLLENCATGLDITGATHTVITRKLTDMLHLSGLQRWLCLVEILSIIASAKDTIPITHTTMVGSNAKESDRLCAVLDWITARFDSQLTLREAAAVAGMQENAFSRFFAARTRKTFSGFIQELRLQKAARLLVQTEGSVTGLCFECGYNNVSNFNRQFRNRYQLSPGAYRRAFREGELHAHNKQRQQPTS